MPDPLDPARLTPTASLNRVRIVDLPGLPLDPDVRGRTGYELLSAQALAAAIRPHAAALALTAKEQPDDTLLLPAFDRSLASHDPAVRAVARDLARRFGRSLGYLLLTLRRGDLVNRQARGEWDDTYWSHWAGIRVIWLGGGLVRGRLGRHLRRSATDLLAASGASDLAPRISAHPALLPLIGAARAIPPSAHRAALVLDFGSGAVKRALARYDAAGALAALHPFPSLPAPQLAGDNTSAPTPDQARALAVEMARVIASSWREASIIHPDHSLTPHISVSLAAYVRDGHPLPRQGSAYSALHALPENAASALSRRVSALVDRPLEVSLLHDGSAAACARAGASHAAVILLGTALGVGFVPREAASLRPLAQGFARESSPAASAARASVPLN